MREKMKKTVKKAALAKKVGTKQSAIARFESGATNPTIGFLYRIARALDAQIYFSIR